MLIVLKIILCSGILLGLYHLFLVREKTFTFNRFYLVAALLFSLCIPFATIETKEAVKEIPATVFVEGNEQPIEAQIVTPQESFDYTKALLIGYCIVSGILILKIGYSIIKIKKLKGRKIKYQNRTVFLLKQDLAPFSFWSTIYLSETYFKDSKIEDSVFLHEEIHVKQKHSLDILFVEIVKAVLWINPFIWFYKKAMINNHEFIADESVISKNKNIKNYQELILQEILKQQNLPLIHQFNFNNTKKRFIMMNNKNSKFAKVKNYFAVPAFAVLAIVFAEKTYAKDTSENSDLKSESIISLNSFTNDPYNEYKNALKKYSKFIDNYDYSGFTKNLSKEDKKNLYELFIQLTEEQQNNEKITFFKNQNKLKKRAISDSEFNEFKNNSKYIVVVDGKKIDNLASSNYKKEDFVVSMTAYNAEHLNVPQEKSVILMTPSYYKKYLKNEEIVVGFNGIGYNDIKKDTISPRKNINTKVSEVKTMSEKPNSKAVQDISTAVEGVAVDLVPAEYPGGVNELRKKVSKNFNSAIFGETNGLVRSTITFVVDKNGSIRDLKAEGENEKFNNEVFRVTKEANENITWKPATKDGEPVAYRYNLPIAMQFAAYKKTQ
ncbi:MULTISPECIES: M56 family metallopeptidase [Chryseobacterium]|uniref:M56 family metallopeptidase n=1 Tax=Chryseobacterium TaxID=59732 RepID=UPI000C9E81CC|nr:MULTISPECIES: M56 family metallopeptidase [Chryseobacterium]VXC47417.1 BlaR1 peptidase M56 [Chryseobacterium sp. 8AT]